MLLENKVAIVYGAGGCAVIAAAFAREGARVFLAGPSKPRLEQVARTIPNGIVRTASVDVCDPAAVDAFTAGVFEETGRIDISFDLVGWSDPRKTLMEVSADDLVAPIRDAVRSQLNTVRSAARQMMKRGTGVILALGENAGLGGFSVGVAAVAALHRKWAVELRPFGIRVVVLQAALDEIGNVAAFAASDHARTLAPPAMQSEAARSWTNFVHEAH